MNASFPALGLLQLLHTVRDYPRRWAVPAAVVALAAIVFALVRPATWQASQALIIRNEAAAAGNGPGSFEHADQMKSVQETILELSRSRGVLRGALVEVGPPANYRKSPDAWPSDTDVADLRDTVTLAPPKGTEFGTTEVFYLAVKSRDRARAVALADALCDQLTARFQKIRDAKAQSMIGELNNAVRLAHVDLDEATARLSAIEKEVGPDLAELRMLNDATVGDSTLRRTAGEIATELRAARANYATSRELLAMLQQAQKDQGQLLATPNQLLESQPALRRLKDGLVDAQIHTAQLKGRMSDAHPIVMAARESEKEIGRHLHDELGIAIRGVEADLRLTGDRTRLLEDRLAEVTGRLERLAELRTPYANQVAETAHRTQLLQQAEQQYSLTRATQASASVTSLISRIDTPDAGTKPIGPGRSVIALAGIAGGLLVGLGVLLLTVPPVPVSHTPEAPADPSLPASPKARPAASIAPTTTPFVPENVPPRRPAIVPRHVKPVATALSLAAALTKLSGNGHGSPKA
jgi:polysaccharide biosynthesis transport protein